MLRGRQHRADQHADGQPAALRPGQPGRAAARRSARSRPTRRAPYVGIIFSTVLALGLIVYVAERAEDDVVVNLASVTSLLLLVRVHDRQHRLPGAAPRRRRDEHVPLARAHAGRRRGRCAPSWSVRGCDRDALDLPDRRRADADRRRALGAHLGRPTAASGPRRPGSATSTTWRSERPAAGRENDAGAGRSPVPLTGEQHRPRPRGPARPRAGPAADVPRPRGRRRRRRPAADDAAAGLRRRVRRAEGQDRRGRRAARRSCSGRRLRRDLRRRHRRQRPQQAAGAAADGGRAHLRRLGAGREGRPDRRPVRQAALLRPRDPRRA